MTQQALSPSETLGHFRLERELGRGRLGVVHLAHDTRHDRQVALKVIDLEVAADERFRAHFLREMPRVVRLEHPNIVPVHEAGELDGRLYIAMRHVDGEDLRGLLRRGGPLGVRRVAQIGLQVATALDAAHIRGIVHGSLKPSDVLVDGGAADAPLYVSDFALVPEPCADTAPQEAGEPAVASGYMAPEQFAGGPATARSDVFAMGRLLYDLLTGELFAANGRGRPAHMRLPSVGAAAGPHRTRVDVVIAKACAAQPEDRYPSAGDLARAFLAAVHGREASDEGALGIGAALDGLPIFDEIVAVRRRSDAARVSRAQVAAADARRSYPHVIVPEPAPAARISRARIAALLVVVGLVGVVAIATLLLSAHGDSLPRHAAAGSAAGQAPGAAAGVGALGVPPLPLTPPTATRHVRRHGAGALHGSTAAHHARASPRGPSCAADPHATLCTQTGSVAVASHAGVGTSPQAAARHAGIPGGLPLAVNCPAFTTHSSNGSPIPVDGVTATGLGCHAARAVIDARPTGRERTGWSCPLTGDRFFTQCTNSADRAVAWRDPSGRSQDATSTAATGAGGTGVSGCDSFDTTDAKGVSYLATPLALSGVTCAAAHTMIAGGPALRAEDGWSCPITGDQALTACTRGKQRVSWAMTF